MRHEILYRPSYSLAKISLDRGESLVAETGAMVSMSANIEIETSMRGGLLSSLKRAVLGGESFFVNTFTAKDAGEVSFAPALPGDINTVELSGQTIFAQSGAFLAAPKTIEVDTKFGGAKTFFSGEGLFLLKLSGTGTVFLCSYGAVHEKMLAAGEKLIVDTGHIVAFDESVQYSVKTVGGMKSTLLSGEGLVVELTGPGRILLQTRSTQAFINWLLPHIPKQSSGGS